MTGSDHVLTLITCGDREEARAISRHLVHVRLAAGVQIMQIDSIYRWAGDIVDDQEWLLVAKTRRDRFEEIRDEVVTMHSYEVPPVLMIDIDSASLPYLGWIDDNVGDR